MKESTPCGRSQQVRHCTCSCLGKQTDKTDGFVTLSASNFKCKHHQATPSRLHQLSVPEFFATPCGLQLYPIFCVCSRLRCAVAAHWADQGGVDGELGSTPKRETVGNYFELPVVVGGDAWNIECLELDVLGNSGTSFPTYSCGCLFKLATSAA